MSRVLLLLLVAATAQAQPFTAGRRLLLSDGVLRGTPRVLGIAGAFVAVAEGAEGITRNPAAAAAREPQSDEEFHGDFGLAMHFLPPWAVKEQDWDNDGRLDQPEGPSGALDYLGSQVLYLAGSLQYQGFGFGAGADTQNFVYQATPAGTTLEGFFNLNLTHGFASLGLAVWEDQILLGVGAESTHAVVTYFEHPRGDGLAAPKEWLFYNGVGFQAGALWRPKDEDYRLGLAFRSANVGWPASQSAEGIGPEGAELIPFSQIVSPARLSVGASWALGSSGRHYNITSRTGPPRLGLGTPPARTPACSAAMTRWLVTSQLDVFFPVSDATYAAAFFEQREPGARAVRAGEKWTAVPRLAVEKEAVEDWLRVRLGAYLEGPVVETAPSVRPHFTAGFQLYLFDAGPERMSLGLSFDWAPNFQNLAIALLPWK